MLTPETMKLLGSTKKYFDKNEDGEIAPKLESVEVVLVHCYLVINDYQHTSKVLFSFILNKQFGQLISLSPHSLTMMNTVNSEFSFVVVWFTDQANKALEMRYSTEPRFGKYVKCYGFLSFTGKFGDKYG